jgi:hypothetical protein
MFFAQNKKLILGGAGVVAVWVAVYYLLVAGNWSAAQEEQGNAQSRYDAWMAFYQDKDSKGATLLQKGEAKKKLETDNTVLNKNLQVLRKIELGTSDGLRVFTRAAAKGDDPKNYLDQVRGNIVTRAGTSLRITVPTELGVLRDKAGDDPVQVNLLRLAAAESFINACHKSGITTIKKFQHYAPKLVAYDTPDEEAGEAAEAPKAEAKADEGASRLVQFPMKVTIEGPEDSIGKLLFELQRPSDSSYAPANWHGYLCVRGFQVALRQSGSGVVEGTVAVSALLNEKFARAEEVPIKGESKTGPAGRKVDLGY